MSSRRRGLKPPSGPILNDCANYPKEQEKASEEESYSFSEITVLPCSSEHDLEAYATTDLPDGDFPGDSEIVALAEEFCYNEFPGFIGTEYEESSLYFESFTPTKASWAFDGDREILCLVSGDEGELLTGSMKGSGR